MFDSRLPHITLLFGSEERFLDNRKLDAVKIKEEMKTILRNNYLSLKNNEEVNDKTLKEVRNIISKKIKKIKNKI